MEGWQGVTAVWAGNVPLYGQTQPGLRAATSPACSCFKTIYIMPRRLQLLRHGGRVPSACVCNHVHVQTSKINSRALGDGVKAWVRGVDCAGAGGVGVGVGVGRSGATGRKERATQRGTEAEKRAHQHGPQHRCGVLVSMVIRSYYGNLRCYHDPNNSTPQGAPQRCSPAWTPA